MSHLYFLNEDHTYRPCELMDWANQTEQLWKENKKSDETNIRIGISYVIDFMVKFTMVH